MKMRIHHAAVAVALVFLVGVVFSGRWEWYLRYPHFDKVLHVTGGFVIAWFMAHLFARDSREASPWGSVALLVGMTAIVGIAWELAEYSSNLWFSTAHSGWQAFVYRYFHGGGLADTLGDLVGDIAGALALCALYLPILRRQTAIPKN